MPCLRSHLYHCRIPSSNPRDTRLDACAAGDINANDADSAMIEDVLALPLHWYDRWVSPGKPPSVFAPDLPLAGNPMPWIEWDAKAPVEQYTVHFTQEQIDHLWQSVSQHTSHAASELRISKHDALLSHIWSCVAQAHGSKTDSNLVHCDLVLGTRPAFQPPISFIHSSTMMLNIEMPASTLQALPAKHSGRPRSASARSCQLSMTEIA